MPVAGSDRRTADGSCRLHPTPEADRPGGRGFAPV